MSPQKIIVCAKNHIDILHIHGCTWTRDNEEILTNALKSKVKIRVVMADFYNDVTMNFYSNHMNRNVKEKCQEALKKWKEIYNTSCGNLEIYLFDGAITHALHFNEKYGVIKSIPSCKAYSKGNTITIYSKKLDNGIYEKYEQEFNQIILESKLYSISENNIS